MKRYAAAVVLALSLISPLPVHAQVEEILASGRHRAYGFSAADPASVQVGGSWLTAIGHRSSYKTADMGAISIQADLLTDGSDSFETAYGLPSFGVGFSFIDQSAATLNGGHHLGDIYALYATMRRDLFRKWRLAFGYDMALGGCHTSSIFDNEANRWNWFFGSHMMLYASGGIHLSASITDRLQLVAEAKAIHASNSRLAYPNLGFNSGGVGLSARYALSGVPPRGMPDSWRVSTESYRRGWAYDLQVGGGVHACGTEWLGYYNQTGNYKMPRRWPKASVSADAMYRWNGRFSSGVMLDAFWSSNATHLREYDTAIYGAEEIENSPRYNPFSGGIGIINNVHYRDFAFVHSFGTYLYRHMGIREDHGLLYQKVGLRWYHPAMPLFLSAACKAQLFKAEYLEMSIGWRFD